MAEIEYKTDAAISVDEFLGLLKSCSLGGRRPVDDPGCLEGMLENSNLVVSAWDESRLVGMARSVTDFHYACYLSDLAVDEEYQRRGIGLRLQQITQDQLRPHCSLILLSAPAANGYYPAIGYENNPRCWVLPRNRRCE